MPPLEEFQVNEALASHYGRIFYDPEGGHVELNFASPLSSRYGYVLRNPGAPSSN